MKNWGKRWADSYVEALRAGRHVSCRPHGDSMEPFIHSGQRVTFEPVNAATKIEVGNIVLCQVGNRQLVHFVQALREKRDEYLIANAKGTPNGWVPRAAVFGRVVDKRHDLR